MVISGSTSGEGAIVGTLTPTQKIAGALQGIGRVVGNITVGGCEIEVYSGDYEVIPKKDVDQVLETSGKKMTDDVTVFAIPYWKTSNESGLTAYIGVS